MRYSFLTFLSLTFFLQCGFSQFWESKNSRFSNDSIAVWNISLVNENVIWASAFNVYEGSVGFNYEFTVSSDGGESFEKNEFFGIPDSLHLSYLHAVSADSAWIAMWGDTIGGNSIFSTSDGGYSWTAQSTANFYGTSAFVNIVYFFDSNNGICLGDPNNGYFEHYTTNDGGLNWTRVPVENLPEPLEDENGYNRGKSFDVTDGVVFYGTSKGRLLKSYDMGHSWIALDTDLDKISKLAFKDSLVGIVVGEGIQSKITFNGGQSWYDMAFNTEYYGGQIEFAHGTPGFWCTIWQGGEISGSGYSFNNGSSWTRMDSVFYTDIQFLHDEIGWAGGIANTFGEGGLFKWIGSLNNEIDYLRYPNLRIFPNPNSDFVMIENAEGLNFRLFDTQGTGILKQKIISNLQRISLDGIRAGVYIIEIVNIDNSFFEKCKFVKLK